MIPCKAGHSKCYYISDICTYKLNIHNHLIPCRNGGHLQNCKRFKCNLMFKCISSYCVHWSVVCDVKWDCSEGDDELDNPVCTHQLICVHMYMCRMTLHRCLHLGNVCNGNRDCPFADDEMFCALKKVVGPLQCNCLLLSIECTDVSNTHIATVLQSIFLSICISNSTFTLKSLWTNLETTTVIRLPSNCLKYMCKIFPFGRILLLDLGYNCLREILHNCLSSLWLLRSFYIDNNKITFIEAGAFYNLSH